MAPNESIPGPSYQARYTFQRTEPSDGGLGDVGFVPNPYNAWHFFHFLPLPQGHFSFLPILRPCWLRIVRFSSQ